jgi:hypothetical protein
MSYVYFACTSKLCVLPTSCLVQEMAMRGYVGYLGPLPLEAVAPDAVLNFSEHALDVPTGSDIEQLLGSSRVCIA